MNSQKSQELRSLQEAYLEVYASQEELVEGREGGRFEYNQRHGRPFIDPASSQRRSEKETLGGGTYERGAKRLPKSKRKYDRQVLSGVRAASDQEKQRARKRMGIGENYDICEIILSHLLDEGYAETPEAAEAIMVSMSEEWREEIMEGVRPTPVDKPLDKASFKKRRRSLAGREASADARARGHEGKTWANTGRTYSPDEAKSRRKNMSDTHRSLSYGTAESPDDNTGYPAVKTKNPNKLRKQKAMGEHG